MIAQKDLVDYFRDKALKKEDGEWKALEGGCEMGYWIPYNFGLVMIFIFFFWIHVQVHVLHVIFGVIQL